MFHLFEMVVVSLITSTSDIVCRWSFNFEPLALAVRDAEVYVLGRQDIHVYNTRGAIKRSALLPMPCHALDITASGTVVVLSRPSKSVLLRYTAALTWIDQWDLPDPTAQGWGFLKGPGPKTEDDVPQKKQMKKKEKKEEKKEEKEKIKKEDDDQVWLVVGVGFKSQVQIWELATKTVVQQFALPARRATFPLQVGAVGESGIVVNIGPMVTDLVVLD